jgi:hypothetical protein
MRVYPVLAVGAAALAISTLPSNAGPCAQRVDQAWMQVDAKIQSRLAAGRSLPQGMIALLHHQPTPGSISAAENTLGQAWWPLERAVAALAKAREADEAANKAACDLALAEMQHAIEPTNTTTLPWPVMRRGSLLPQDKAELRNQDTSQGFCLDK